MKGILIAQKPRDCENIVSGEKTIIVCKKMPKLQTSFKGYIFCTKGKPFIQKIRFGDIAISHTQISKNLYNGKVIGEFICDKVERFEYQEKYLRGITSQTAIKYFFTKIKSTALSFDELEEYGKGKTLYGLHITDLKIYDKPKELSEFCRNGECDKCGWFENGKCYKQSEQSTYNNHRIKRPPQSWCYVQELEELEK